MTDRIVKKLVVFRAPQHTSDLPNAWHFRLANDKEFCWRIFNPSGQGYVDAPYIGQGEQHAITPEQAQTTKRQTLVNCALYTARQILPKYGETVTDQTEVEIDAK